jgi:molecular chaperone HscA
MLLLDVIPLSLGLETMGGLAEKVIPRNSTIPTARAQEFTTYKDGQTAMSIHVVQGERELVKDCRSLGRFTLRGIPPMAAGAARIRVAFQVDADGLVSVSAQELTSGVSAQIDVKPSYGLTDAEIATMLQSGFANASADAQARALAEAQTDARRLLEAVDAALAADSALLDGEEQNAIADARTALLAIVGGADVARIKLATDALSRSTDSFAAKRMDRSVAQALRGRAVSELN